MGFFSLSGNSVVIVMTIVSVKKHLQANRQQSSNVGLFNKLLIFNLAAADLVMGIVLLIISIKAAKFSGRYCLEDRTWRSSSFCNGIGVMTVISSEASVLTLVCLTSYRLYTISHPIASRELRLRVLTLWVALIWTTAITLGLLPLTKALAPYVVTGIRTTSCPFFSGNVIPPDQLKIFNHRFSGLVNSSDILRKGWNVNKYLVDFSPKLVPTTLGYYGYYSDNGVCMPRFFRVSKNDRGINFISSGIVTFNFVALLYIAFAYVAIYKRSFKARLTGSSDQQQRRRAALMYRKISILIATDMCCWFPVCIMTFLSMSGVVLHPLSYAIAVIVLLPINSSLNPIIYTTPFGPVKKLLTKWFQSIKIRTTKTRDNSGKNSSPPKVKNIAL